MNRFVGIAIAALFITGLIWLFLKFWIYFMAFNLTMVIVEVLSVKIRGKHTWFWNNVIDKK
jgi:hypothetical protein